MSIERRGEMSDNAMIAIIISVVFAALMVCMAVAAKSLGFRAVGVEMVEEYCEITASRLAQNHLPLEV